MLTDVHVDVGHQKLARKIQTWGMMKQQNRAFSVLEILLQDTPVFCPGKCNNFVQYSVVILDIISKSFIQQSIWPR